MRRARNMQRFGLLLTALGALSGCEGIGNANVLQIEATGVLSGEVFVDLGRTGSREAGDPAVPGLQIAYVLAGTRDTVALAVSDTSGLFGARDLPVGAYLAVPDKGILGDSLEISVLSPSPAEV